MSQQETEKGVQGVVRVTVTSDITVFCNASNAYGMGAVSYNIKPSEFLLLLVFPVSVPYVYASVCLFMLTLSSPSSLSLFRLFLLYVSSLPCDVLPMSLDILITVVLSCVAVKCVPVHPSVLTGSALPFCAS